MLNSESSQRCTLVIYMPPSIFLCSLPYAAWEPLLVSAIDKLEATPGLSKIEILETIIKVLLPFVFAQNAACIYSEKSEDLFLYKYKEVLDELASIDDHDVDIELPKCFDILEKSDLFVNVHPDSVDAIDDGSSNDVDATTVDTSKQFVNAAQYLFKHALTWPLIESERRTTDVGKNEFSFAHSLLRFIATRDQEDTTIKYVYIMPEDAMENAGEGGYSEEVSLKIRAGSFGLLGNLSLVK